MRPLALASLALLLAAGCLEADGADKAGRAASEAAPDASLLAYRASRDAANATYLLLYADARAERYVVFDDRSALVRLPPELAYPRAPLDELLAQTLGGMNRSIGGVVLRIEEGRVPEPAWSRVRAALEAPWPEAPAPVESEAPLYVRMTPRAILDEVAPGVEPVAAAFEEAEAALVVERIQEPALPEAGDDATGTCALTEVRPSPTVISPGERMEIAIDVRNCGAAPLELSAPWCGEPPFLVVDVLLPGGGLRNLPPSDAATAAYGLDFRCRGERAPLVLAPGQNATVLRHWNGTLAECAGDACSFAPAHGRHGVVAYATGQREMAQVEAIVLPPETPRIQLLLVRELDWVNATGEGAIRASFGPHCATVAYTLEPPTVGQRHYAAAEDNAAPSAPRGMVVRDWRGGERPGDVVTTSADRLDALRVEDAPIALRSPFEPTETLATVALDGDAFRVGNETLAPGERLTLRFERTIETSGATFDVVTVLDVLHAGEAAYYVENVGGCA